MNHNNRFSRLTIIQHNVQCWQTSNYALANIYNSLHPDIILINEHSLTNSVNPKIFNYNIISSNKQNQKYRGTAIAIRSNIHPRIHDNFYSDLLAVTIETTNGPLTIATIYNPPRDDYINLSLIHI